MQVQESALKGMIRNISDPKLREQYGNIISGKYPYRVFCMNPQKNPETKRQYHPKKMEIGYIDIQGNAIDTQTVEKKTREPIAGIATSRDRFDGRKGFRCYCGNSSIRADEEAAVIGSEAEVPRFSRPPSRKELGDIFSQLQKSGKGPLQFSNGWAEYDGFALQEVQL